MSTPTTGFFEDTSTTTGSFMLPGMGSPEQVNCSRVVRFNNECVLIPKATSPTRSKMPVVLTKSYSLPLWKKKSQQSPDSDVEDAAAGSSVRPSSLEDNRVTIKVPIPMFRTRSSRSPSLRARSISSSPPIPKSLPSCLVYRTSSELVPSSGKPLTPIHRPSLPVYHRRQDELTIPLRDCCADCERITEESLKEGDDWKEKFSRGARRRRSASLDYSDPTTLPSLRNTRAFTPFSTEGISTGDLTSRFSPTAATFSIMVDEVDKRRKSFDYSMEDTDFIRTLSPPSGAPSASPFASSSGTSRYPRMKPRDREASSNSTLSSVSTTDESLQAPDIPDSRNRLRSSPIEEEDETQLFPLPRRSRSNTPSPSISPKMSPSQSFNGSTSSLPRLSPTSSSKLNSSSSSQDNILSNSLSRKVKNRHPDTASLSSLSASRPLSRQPKHTTLHLADASPNVSSFHVSSKAPSTCESFDIHDMPSSPTQVPFTASSPTSTISDQNTEPLLFPPIPNSPYTDNKNKTLEIALTLPESNSCKSPPPPPPPSSPTTLSNQSPLTRRPSQQKLKLSFTLPFMKAGGAIRGVGVDVLKGVSSISSSSALVGNV